MPYLYELYRSRPVPVNARNGIEQRGDHFLLLLSLLISYKYCAPVLCSVYYLCRSDIAYLRIGTLIENAFTNNIVRYLWH